MKKSTLKRWKVAVRQGRSYDGSGCGMKRNGNEIFYTATCHWKFY